MSRHPGNQRVCHGCKNILQYITMRTLNINGKSQAATVSGSTPILFALRGTLGLTGTQCGCGAALCTACGTLMSVAVGS